MKAVFFQKHGDLDVLQYGTLPDPQPGPDEVVVDVKACALNHLDIWIRQGLPGIQIPLPHVLGCESAGIISQIGKKVKKFKVGQAVLVEPGTPCRKCRACQSGWDSSCAHYQLMGFQRDGGYAEKVKAPQANLIPIATQRLSFEQWASIPLVFVTAWHMLVTRAGLKKGETVLVQASGSGVGIAAIQVARLLGARVIATAGSDEKLLKAKQLGAHVVVNYKKEDVAERVKEATKGQGVDVVFEHVGPETWESSMKSLGKKGRVVTCGATTGPTVTIDLRFLFMKQLSILGSYMGGRKELDQVIKYVKLGKLKPVVDRVFPLAQARQAQELMLSRNFFGKIILKP